MLAVKFYSQVAQDQKPAGIPDNWPAECVELHNNESAFDDTWTIMTRDEYVAYRADAQEAFDAWVQSTIIPPDQAAIQLAYVKSRIAAARIFGIGLVTEYGATNVLAGKTTEQVQQIMQITGKVVVALNTGSLYVSLAELAAIVPDDTLITAAQVTFFRNKIQDYVGVPRT